MKRISRFKSMCMGIVIMPFVMLFGILIFAYGCCFPIMCILFPNFGEQFLDMVWLDKQEKEILPI